MQLLTRCCSRMADHSIIACSSAHRWGAPGGCRASALLEAMYPETEEREEAREGTAVAELGAAMVTAEARAGVNYPTPEFRPANGVIITDELWQCAKAYADIVARRMQETLNFNPWVEAKVRAPRVHPTESYGTLDCALIHFNKIVDLYELKAGFVRVDAFENWQSINYAAGILDQLQVNGLDDQQWLFRLHVVQPRYYKRRGIIDTWEINGAHLRGYINQLAHAAAEALSNNAKVNPGPHCYGCSALAHCDSALNYAFKIFQQADEIGVRELPPAALGLQLRFIKRAIEQLGYLEAAYAPVVELKIRSGQSVPGWGTKDKYGRENWTASYEQRTTIADLMGVDIRKKETLTPRQAILAKLPEELVKELSSRQKTGVEIVEDDINLARRIFNNG